MFSDNQSVVTSSTIPSSTLNKRHNALSYYHVCESIASNTIFCMHVEVCFNPSDIFTKYLGWNKFWPLIQLLLFWKSEIHVDFGNRPIAFTIKKNLKVASISQGNPPSGLRGVTQDINSSDCEHWVVVTSNKKKNTRGAG